VTETICEEAQSINTLVKTFTGQDIHWSRPSLVNKYTGQDILCTLLKARDLEVTAASCNSKPHENYEM